LWLIGGDLKVPFDDQHCCSFKMAATAAILDLVSGRLYDEHLGRLVRSFVAYWGDWRKVPVDDQWHRIFKMATMAALKLKFPSALYLLSEWRVLIDTWREDQRCVTRKIRVDASFDLDPVNLIRNCIIIPFCSLLVDIWWEGVPGHRGVSHERIVSMRLLTLTLWPWNRNFLPLCIS
jgi:hypothetical protein